MSLHIRPIEPQDARAIRDIMIQESVMPYVIAVPSMRVESFETRIRSLTPNDHEFVAERDGRVVGMAGVRMEGGRRRHNAYLYIAVDEAVHGQGVGTALMNTLIDLCDNWLHVERIELGVLSVNPRAKALYERLGFVVEGRKICSQISNGQYVDEILMARFHPKGALKRT